MRFNAPVIGIIASPVRLKVAGFLLTHDAPMSEREIASILKISHMSINRVMAELAGVNLVAFNTVGKAHVWMVNRKSYAYKVLKEILGSVKAQPTPLLVLKQQVLKYLSKPVVSRVSLFGSLVTGQEREDSDIDLFVLVKSDKDKENIEPAIGELSAVCLDLFGNRLAPYILSQRELKAKKLLAVVKAAEKGMVLYESKV